MFLKKTKIIKYLIFLILIILSFLFGTYSIYKRIWPFNDGGFLHQYFGEEDFETDSYWANEVVKGGYVLYVRHAEREKWNDIVTAYDAYELINKIDARESTFYRATCLTERGIEDAKLLGKVFNHANVKISKIFSSPSCRSRETAINAFGKIDKYVPAILHATAINPKEWDKMTEKLKNTILDCPDIKGSNCVISGHNGTLSKYYDLLLDKKNLPPARYLEQIKETSFHVLQIDRKNNSILYKHKFEEFRDFALHVFNLADIPSWD